MCNNITKPLYFHRLGHEQQKLLDFRLNRSVPLFSIHSIYTTQFTNYTIFWDTGRLWRTTERCPPLSLPPFDNKRPCTMTSETTQRERGFERFSPKNHRTNNQCYLVRKILITIYAGCPSKALFTLFNFYFLFIPSPIAVLTSA